jgi:hypothetical protein
MLIYCSVNDVACTRTPALHLCHTLALLFCLLLLCVIVETLVSASVLNRLTMSWCVHADYMLCCALLLAVTAILLYC